MWRCACERGAETTVRAGRLTSGNTKSCGCHKTKVKKGNKYGELVAIERIKTSDGFKWRCECSCGNEAVVIAGNLYTGKTKSCGCLNPINTDITEEERKSKRRYLAKEGEISYSTWRIHVHKKCNSTCVVCGYVHQEPHDIIAHHSDGYDWCDEKRADIDNGVTLCQPCHVDFNKKYGQHKNTKEQFDEYLQTTRQTEAT